MLYLILIIGGLGEVAAKAKLFAQCPDAPPLDDYYDDYEVFATVPLDVPLNESGRLETVAHAVVEGLTIEEGESAWLEVSPYNPAELAVGVSRQSPEMLGSGYRLKGLFLLETNLSDGSGLLEGDWKNLSANPALKESSTSMRMDVTHEEGRLRIYYTQTLGDGTVVPLGRAFDIDPKWPFKNGNEPPIVAVLKYPKEANGTIVNVTWCKGGVPNERQAVGGVGGTFDMEIGSNTYELNVRDESGGLVITARFGNTMRFMLPVVNGIISGEPDGIISTRMAVHPSIMKDWQIFLDGLVVGLPADGEILGKWELVRKEELRTVVIDIIR